MYAAAISIAVPSRTSSSHPGIPATGLRMPARGRGVGFADALADGAGATACAVPGAVAALPALPVAGTVLVPAVDASDVVPDVAPADFAAGTEAVAAGAAVAGPAVVDPAAADPADAADPAGRDCRAVGALAKAADAVGCAAAAAGAGAAAVLVGRLAELVTA
jgi:hypothetical protein